MPTRLLIVTAALCVVFSTTATAQVTTPPSQQSQAEKAQDVSQEKQALVRELLETIDFKKSSEAILKTMFDQMEKQMPEIIWQGLSGMKEIKELTPADQQHLRDEITQSAAKTSQRFRELLTKRIDFARMSEEVSTALYAKYFSESELRDLIAFYKSSTGKHTMEIMPSLFAESMTQANERMMPVVKDLMNEISNDETMKFQTEIAALVKSHHKASTPRSRSRQSRPKGQ